ncbi:MAG: branched-chain amino acid ABC transporter permease [Spirochaetaceae bacterium]|nr:MAG: branched-chain amino acid ABC transporter permease [Spirochaetaceae bacterium]
MNWNILLQQLVNGISLGGVYALMAVGFGLIFNVLKFSNFSHGGVVTLTAYIGFFLSQHLLANFVITFIITAVVGGFAAVAIERLVFRPIRRKGYPISMLIVNSITVAMLVQQFFAVTFGSDYYTYPVFIKETALHVGNLTVSKIYLLMLGISAVVLGGLSYVIRKTKIGIAIRAASSDISTPSLMGVNVDLVISVAFFFSGVLGGITGYLLGMTFTVDPFIGSMILKGIIASIIGGMGSIFGGVIAGLILGAAESLLIAEIGAALTPIVIYGAIIVLLLVRPQGIAGKISEVKA